MESYNNPCDIKSIYKEAGKMREFYLWMLVVIAGFAVVQKRSLHGVILRLILSTLVVGAYIYYMAPDVALTEAMVGALLTTYVYILALRGINILRVGFVDTKLLFEKRPVGYDGIEYVLLKNFCDSFGYKMEVKQYKSEEELWKALERGEIDVACGDVVDNGIEILETKVYIFKDGKKRGLLNIGVDERGDVVSERKGFYTMKFINHGSEFEAYLSEMKRKGKFDEVIEKYAR